MKAFASVKGVRTKDGGTRLEELISQPPLTFRETVDGLMLVNTAAGPLGGDTLHLKIELLANAKLNLGAVAAAIALPGSSDSGPSESLIEIVLAQDSMLIWIPQPLIIAKGSHHKQTVRIVAAESSRFVYGDIYSFGRHKEETGRLEQSISIDIAGLPALRQSLDINPEEDWQGPLSLQGRKSLASFISFGITGIEMPNSTLFELDNGIQIVQSYSVDVNKVFNLQLTADKMSRIQFES